jgi:hypothetical protein
LEGEHDLRVEYFEDARNALIRVWWERVTSPVYPDWQGSYWSNRSLIGEPDLVRNDRAIDFDWGTGAAAKGLPANDFSARWSRAVSFDIGIYRFHARADDGIRLYIDDELVLDEWHVSAGDELYVVDQPLQGDHQLIVEYFEAGGEASAEVWWRRIEGGSNQAPVR